MSSFRVHRVVRRSESANGFSTRPPARRHVPLAEVLEGRRLLTSVVVNAATDVMYPQGSGLISLRNAIAIVDASTSPTTITFDPEVFAAAQTIPLTNGTLELSNTAEPTTITGPTAGVMVEYSGDTDSGIVIDANVTATINGLAESGGGGINNYGVLTLNGDTVSSSSGITNEAAATVDMTNVASSNNSAGLSNLGTATVTGGSISYNSHGVYQIQGGAVTLSNVTISNNNDGKDGAGIDNEAGSVTLNNVILSGNSAGGGGGGIYNNNTDRATGVLTMTNVTVSGNTAVTGAGGGIYNVGTATMTDVTISGNDARPGNQDPYGGYGGGVYNDGTLTLTNVTIANNTATGGDSASATYGGGGLYNDAAGTATLNDVTISGNSVPNGVGTASGGGGIYNGAPVSNFSLGNTIVAGNNSGNLGPDVYGSFTSESHNLVGQSDNGSGFGGSDLVGTSANPLDPKLGVLANNGGPTLTLLPIPGSPVIDSGSNSLIPGGVSTDQRGDGFARIFNGTVDIGAVEYETGETNLGSASTTSLAASADSVALGNPVIFTATVTGNAGASPTGTVSFISNGSLLGTAMIQPNGTAAFTTSALPAGNDGITASYAGDGTYRASTSSAVSVTVGALSPISANFVRPVFPITIVAGAKLNAKLPVLLLNSGAGVKGLFTFNYYANSSPDLDGNQTSLTSLSKKLSLKAGKSVSITTVIKSLPSSLPSGAYYFVTEVVDPTGLTNVAATSQTVTVAEPFVKLSASVGPVGPSPITVPHAGSISITIPNNGNVAASGSLSITITPSSDGITPLPVVLATYLKKTTIVAGKSRTIKLHIRVPAALMPGNYFPYVTISLSGNTVTAVGLVPFAVG